MIIEIGTRVWFDRNADPLTVVNVAVNEHSDMRAYVYFDNGGDMPAEKVFEKAYCWG